MKTNKVYLTITLDLYRKVKWLEGLIEAEISTNSVSEKKLLSKLRNKQRNEFTIDEKNYEFYNFSKKQEKNQKKKNFFEKLTHKSFLKTSKNDSDYEINAFLPKPDHQKRFLDTIDSDNPSEIESRQQSVENIRKGNFRKIKNSDSRTRLLTNNSKRNISESRQKLTPIIPKPKIRQNQSVKVLEKSFVDINRKKFGYIGKSKKKKTEPFIKDKEIENFLKIELSIMNNEMAENILEKIIDTNLNLLENLIIECKAEVVSEQPFLVKTKEQYKKIKEINNQIILEIFLLLVETLLESVFSENIAFESLKEIYSENMRTSEIINEPLVSDFEKTVNLLEFDSENIEKNDYKLEPGRFNEKHITKVLTKYFTMLSPIYQAYLSSPTSIIEETTKQMDPSFY